MTNLLSSKNIESLAEFSSRQNRMHHNNSHLCDKVVIYRTTHLIYANCTLDYKVLCFSKHFLRRRLIVCESISIAQRRIIWKTDCFPERFISALYVVVRYFQCNSSRNNATNNPGTTARRNKNYV